MRIIRHCLRWLLASGLLLWIAIPAAAQDTFPWQRYEGFPNSWYESFEAKQIALNVLSHQTPAGSWPKNIDTGANKFEGDMKTLRGTYEAGATMGEMRYLARIFFLTKDERYKAGFDKGLKGILDAQYKTGGWPPFFPPGKTYSKHIAFDDNCMLSVLDFLREIPDGRQYAFLRKDMIDTVGEAFDRGVECILKCQIVVNGEARGWCAWHDEKTLKPSQGRKYEPPSVCSRETASILIFLMSLEKPSPAAVKAVHAACTWYEQVRYAGIRLETQGGTVTVVRDNAAPYLWARNYEIDSNKAMFLTIKGEVKYKFTDIEPEMRNSFPWYGPWPNAALRRYDAWKVDHPREHDTPL